MRLSTLNRSYIWLLQDLHNVTDVVKSIVQCVAGCHWCHGYVTGVTQDFLYFSKRLSHFSAIIFCGLILFSVLLSHKK